MNELQKYIIGQRKKQIQVGYYLYKAQSKAKLNHVFQKKCIYNEERSFKDRNDKHKIQDSGYFSQEEAEEWRNFNTTVGKKNP